MGELAPYAGESERATAYAGRKVFKCPAYQPRPQWQTYCFNGWIFNPTYGVKRMNQIGDPDTTIFIYDSRDGYVADSTLINSTKTIYWLHQDRANFLMANGSVQTFKQDSALGQSYLDYHWTPAADK